MMQNIIHENMLLVMYMPHVIYNDSSTVEDNSGDMLIYWTILNTLQWRHSERDGVLNQRRLKCLLNRLFRRRSNKETSKHRATGLCEGKPLT